MGIYRIIDLGVFIYLEFSRKNNLIFEWIVRVI